ncbi:MAG: hydrogenase maturation protease [Chloroflexi bacterium]|nr:hydrogenase maturation protease [Chloroflexota bacterium]
MGYLPSYYEKETLILGCGNILFGDDGFGPAVVDYINNHCRVPDFAEVLDVGTGVRKLLFDIIVAEKRPKKLVIIDALDCGHKAGEVFMATVEQIPAKKINDFSLHLMPTINMLKEVRDLCGVEVHIVAAQPKSIPDTAEEGLSVEIEKAVKEAAEYACKNYL